MTWDWLYVVLSIGWRGQTTKRGPRQNLDSWERLGSAFVAAPPLSKYSKLFIPCRPFLSSSTLFVPSHFIERGGRGGEPLSKQWRKGGCHLYPVPRRTRSKLSSRADSLMSESWINCFKPKGAGHPSPNVPRNVLLQIIKACHYTRCTNSGQPGESGSVFTLLFMVSEHSKEKLAV